MGRAIGTVIEGTLAEGTVAATTASTSCFAAPANIPKAIGTCIAVAILLANSG